MAAMNYRAYLVAHLGAPVGYQGLMPVVVRVDIYSAPAGGLTHDTETWPVDLFQSVGKSFSEAQENLLEDIRHISGLAWVFPWVEDNGRDGHMAQFHMANEHKAAITGNYGPAYTSMVLGDVHTGQQLEDASTDPAFSYCR
jgi:hypothetical protein